MDEHSNLDFLSLLKGGGGGCGDCNVKLSFQKLPVHHYSVYVYFLGKSRQSTSRKEDIAPKPVSSFSFSLPLVPMAITLISNYVNFQLAM